MRIEEETDVFFDEIKGITVQLKLCKTRDGNSYAPSGHEFGVSQDVPFADGIYIGHNAAVIIIDGMFIGCLEFVYDKWGLSFDKIALLKPRFEAYRFTIGMRKAEAKAAARSEEYE